MLSWVLKDYFAALRWSNVKKSFWSWWWGIQFLVMSIFLQVFDSTDETETALYLCVMIPILFCMLMETLHKTLLPKMIYLCPMSAQERKKYILISCGVRIAIPTFVGMVGALILLVCGMVDWIYSVGVIFNITALSICMGACLYVNGPSKWGENGTLTSSVGVLEIFILIVTLITGILYASWEGALGAYMWLKVVFLVVQLLVMVPMIVSYLKKWQKSTEQALLYENSGALYKEKQRTGR